VRASALAAEHQHRCGQRPQACQQRVEVEVLDASTEAELARLLLWVSAPAACAWVRSSQRP
jgi:hypothetical protein